ncbi:MerR family transcriptional regulator [Aneurinibacillus aneurinilyticus]|uniref:MerR family transcriptional regulator n=1 Tax=Aneurinibacillus aneurinilyticus TaxID=1391 RepID=UPI00366E5BAD
MITEHNFDTYTVDEVAHAIGVTPQSVHAYVQNGRLEKKANNDRRYSLYGYRLDKEAVYTLYVVENHFELLCLNPQNYHQAKAEGLL